MAQENVELIRRLFEATAHRDSATVLSLYDPEAEWDVTRTHGGLMRHDIYRGHEGLRRYFREWDEVFDRPTYEVEELFDVGDDEVVSVVAVRGRGRESGVAVAWAQRAGLWKIRDAKIVSVIWFPNRDEALEAVGLRDGGQ